jgi:hypothetical protein
MRPRPPFFRLSVTALAASQVLAACQRQQPAPPAAETPPVVAPPEPAPLAPAALDRAALLRALEVAAAAYASGKASAEDDVVGRRFVVRQAFGCQGPSEAAGRGVARWTWGRDRRSVEITMIPADWSDHPAFGGDQGPWEAVEGFWISRPWMREGGCPAAPAPSPAPEGAAQSLPKTAPAAKAPMAKAPSGSPVGSAPPSVLAFASPEVAGLAAVFAREGSRVGRRDGKPFTFSMKAEGEAPVEAPQGGLRLVIEGRLVAFPEGGAVRCVAPSTEVRPVCFAAAEVDRVAYEDAEGKLLREWRPG